MQLFLANINNTMETFLIGVDSIITVLPLELVGERRESIFFQ